MIVIFPDRFSNRSPELVTGRNRFGAFLWPPVHTASVSPLYKCSPLEGIDLETYRHDPSVFKHQFLNE